MNSVVAQTSITGAIGEKSKKTNSYSVRSWSNIRFNSTLARIVGGSGGPDRGIAGRNAICVDWSVQTTSDNEASPAVNSAIPLAASGATDRVSDGFLRSQSTRTTEAPFRAMSCPTANATVDFPSFGIAEVKPTTFPDLDLLSMSIAILIERTPSEKRERGWSTTVQLIPLSPRASALGAMSVCACLNRLGRLAPSTLGRTPTHAIPKRD